jgi:hypothetical protein
MMPPMMVAAVMTVMRAVMPVRMTGLGAFAVKRHATHLARGATELISLNFAKGGPGAFR